MLTTVDNPFDPFTQFSEWFVWDTNAGYNSTALLARIALLSEELSEKDQNVAIENAIDEIILYNVLGVHRKVTKEVEE